MKPIKLQAIQRFKPDGKTPLFDKGTLNGKILTVNGIDFDFDNLTEDSSLPVYKDADGNIYVTLAVPHNRLYLFRQWGMKRYFDIDDNNIIDLAEFKVALDYINETDNVKLENDLDAIKKVFIKKCKSEGMSDRECVMAWRLKGKPLAA
jgi:hypothetical protein